MTVKSKIISAKALVIKISALKKSGKKIVFTNGCFDLIHAGHVRTFQKAKTFGDILIVAINTDVSVRKIKGKNRPIVDQQNRAKVLAALESVDFVTFFSENTPLEILELLRPDVLVKGADYKLNEIVGRQYVKKVKRIAMVKGISTSFIISKILKAYAK